MRARGFLLAVAALLGLLPPPAAEAQSYPVRPVRLVVPFPPGGSLDIAGRLLAEPLQRRWGQPVVVENKPGGTSGVDAVVRSAPDGYTLLIISSSPLLTLHHLQRVSYDPLRDLAPVARTTLLTYTLVVNPAMEIRSVAELIARARAAPGKIDYASAGNGSGQHLYMELLKAAAAIALTHVPYKGAAPALQAVLAGDVPLMMDVAIATEPAVKAGKLRAILVTGDRALPQFPAAEPFDRLFPGYGIPTWHGVFAPAGTPRELVDSLARDIADALSEPAVRTRFAEMGVVTAPLSGPAFQTMVRRDDARWGEIISRNGLRAD